MSRFISYLNSCNCRLPSSKEGQKETKKEFSQEYLTFEALEDGTFTFTPKNNNVISYSINGGNTWTEGNSIEVSNGDKVMWKGEMIPGMMNGIGSFSTSINSFNIQGNIMSLLYGDNFKNQTNLSGKAFVFSHLFDGMKVVNAENLSLPATVLAVYCYEYMFNNCASLITAPQLPATTLAQSCYIDMFKDCASLITAPQLPATTLAQSCYIDMFKDCASLNYIKAMFTTTPGSSYTNNWVNGVASSGTFIKNSAATWNVSGANGVPTGWTVETA